MQYFWIEFYTFSVFKEFLLLSSTERKLLGKNVVIVENSYNNDKSSGRMAKERKEDNMNNRKLSVNNKFKSFFSFYSHNFLLFLLDIFSFNLFTPTLDYFQFTG